MPRDGSGNYTLPAGNPVATATTIDVAWANPTMSDIATQLNNVVTRDGKLGLTAQSKGVVGLAGTPTYSFNAPAPANSGLYSTLSAVGLSVGGTSYIECSSVGVILGAAVQAPNLIRGSFSPAVGLGATGGIVALSFPGTTWQYFGYGSLIVPTKMMTIVGRFDVEPGGGPTGPFSFEFTPPIARLAGQEVGGSGGIYAVSGGASEPDIAIAYAVEGTADTSKIKVKGRTPSGFINGGGKRYQFTIAITYQSNG